MRRLLLIAAMTLPLSALSTPLVAQLRGHVRVAGAWVTVADVAELKGNATQVAQAGKLELAQAPRVGFPERFRREQVAAALRLPPGALDWTGPEAVTVSRAAQVVDTELLAKTATDAVLAWFGEPTLKVSVTGDLPAVEVPLGKVALRGRQLSAGRLAARVLAPVDIDVDGKFYRSVNVPVQLSLNKMVLVARRELAVGQALAPADVELVERDIAQSAVRPVASLPAKARTRRAVGAGHVLAAADLMEEGTVVRGDRVQLRARHGGAGIEADALVVRGGRVGELVGVTVGAGQAVLQARLVSPGLVVLQ